jgi:CPA1 family monovalent cation:H+ antiporter
MERLARIRTIDSAIRSIRELMNDENHGAAVSVISSYNQIRNRLNMASVENSEQRKLVDTEIRMKALDAEASYIQRLVKAGRIDRKTTYLSEEHIQRMRLAVTNRMTYRRLFFWTLVKRGVYHLLQLFLPNKQERMKIHHAKMKQVIQLKVNMAKAAISYLKNHMSAENEYIYLNIIGEYNDMIMKFKSVKKGADSTHHIQLQRELQIKAFQAERDEIQSLYEEGEISIDVTRKIRKQINIREAYWMEESSLHSL